MKYLSLFSGIEAASAAWGPLGWQCTGVSEIEPYPCKLLAAKYPEVPNLGSVTRVALCAKYGPERLMYVAARYPRSRLASAYADLAEAMIFMPDTDIMVFGSPCQDLSVAGKREGLEGERSGLFYAAVLIGQWLRREKRCRFWLWENVPGAFSSNDGRDFAIVVGAMAGLAEPPEVPEFGWGLEGATVGEALLEWSTLDAQWFGVAQRRRRCFALADFGDWAGRPPVLLESESLRGDTAPQRVSWEDPAAAADDGIAGGSVAGTLTARGAGGFPGTDEACNGYVIPVVGTLRASSGGPDLEHARAGQFLVVGDVAGTLCADGKSAGFNGQAARQGKLVVCVSNAEGTRGLPFLTVANLSKQFNNQMPLLAFAFKASHFTRGKDGAPSDVAPPLSADADKGDQDTLIFHGFRVRRLTPLECERLQDFPDHYTQIADGDGYVADTPRYKALGNTMCVAVMRWIGRSIEFAILRY